MPFDYTVDKRNGSKLTNVIDLYIQFVAFWYYCRQGEMDSPKKHKSQHHCVASGWCVYTGWLKIQTGRATNGNATH